MEISGKFSKFADTAYRLSIFTRGIQLGNNHFFQVCFHLDSNNRRAVDENRKIVSPI